MIGSGEWLARERCSHKYSKHVLAVVAFILALAPSLGYAEFTLDYAPKNGAVWTTTSGRFNVASIPNQTKFAIEDLCCMNDYEGPEMVVDPSNGKTYYHVLLGDLVTDGFISETYIEVDTSVLYGVDGVNVHGYGPVSWSRPGSASGVEINDLAYPCCGPQQVQGGNQLRILSQNAGNGTGDPRKVIVRQQLSFSEMTMEFLKDSYATKPLISLAIDNADIHVEYVSDMRTVSYSDDLTPLSVLNQMYLKGSSAPPDSATFDITTDAQTSNVTAGQFIYVPGSYLPADGYGSGAGGTYAYSEGAFDQYGVDWASYLDPAISNPWSYAQQ